MKLIILAYHHITKDESDINSRLYMSKHKFKEQMKYIKNMGFDIVSCRDEIKSNRNDSIMITFDDAYNDFYELAFPILKELSISSVLFVPTSKIGLRMYEPDYKDFQTYISKKDLEFLNSSSIVNIQPHGYSHVPLAGLTDNQQYDEVIKSGNYFKNELDRLPNLFCLPYGSYNRATLEILKNESYHYVFTTINGINQINKDVNKQLLLKRIAFKSSIETEEFVNCLEDL